MSVDPVERLRQVYQWAAKQEHHGMWRRLVQKLGCVAILGPEPMRQTRSLIEYCCDPAQRDWGQMLSWLASVGKGMAERVPENQA